MQIILLHDVDKVGRRGEAVAVADGYARNFLFPKGLAVRADTAKKRELEQRLRALEARDTRERGGAEERARALEGVAITIRTAASEEGRLYGSVTAQMIAAALEEQGHEVDPKQIEIAEPLKALGEYPIPVRLHRDVKTDIALTVERA